MCLTPRLPSVTRAAISMIVCSSGSSPVISKSIQTSGFLTFRGALGGGDSASWISPSLSMPSRAEKGLVTLPEFCPEDEEEEEAAECARRDIVEDPLAEGNLAGRALCPPIDVPPRAPRPRAPGPLLATLAASIQLRSNVGESQPPSLPEPPAFFGIKNRCQGEGNENVIE